MEKWKKKEKKDSQDFLGKRTKASGNQWSAPGDVKTSDFLIDSKQTDRKSFSVTYEMWNKIEEEALFQFRYPMLSIQLQDKEIVVLSKEDFIKLIKKRTSP
jgi:hypothetical protein